MMADASRSVRLWKALLVGIAVVTLLALWLLLSFITPGTWRFIQTRGWGDFLLGYGFMAGPAVLALILTAIHLRRPAVPPVLLLTFAAAAMIYTIYVAFQFAMY